MSQGCYSGNTAFDHIYTGDCISQSIYPSEDIFCIPALKKVVCRWGAKCFHNIHYSTTYTPLGATASTPIPPGACISGIPAVHSISFMFRGYSPGNICAQITVCYVITAVVTDAHGVPIGVINKYVVDKPLCIPIVAAPNVACIDDCKRLLLPGYRTFRVYSAGITIINHKKTAFFKVEKEIAHFEIGKALVCEPNCSPHSPSCTPPMPTPPTSPSCPTYTTPTVCFVWD